jgi:hypothetical protein
MKILKTLFGCFYRKTIRDHRLIYELSLVKDAPKWTFKDVIEVKGIRTYAYVNSVYDENCL